MWKDTVSCRVMNYSRNFINLIVKEREEIMEVNLLLWFPRER
jgi:hypothetical protein